MHRFAAPLLGFLIIRVNLTLSITKFLLIITMCTDHAFACSLLVTSSLAKSCVTIIGITM
jgi:hypothetical protein